MLSVDLSQTKRMMKRRTLQSMEINPEFLQAVVPVVTHLHTLLLLLFPQNKFIYYSLFIQFHNTKLKHYYHLPFYNYSVQLYFCQCDCVSLYMHCIIIIKLIHIIIAGVPACGGLTCLLCFVCTLTSLR